MGYASPLQEATNDVMTYRSLYGKYLMIIKRMLVLTVTNPAIQHIHQGSELDNLRLSLSAAVAMVYLRVNLPYVDVDLNSFKYT